MNKVGVMNTRDPSAYKCCFCCHVKVGTIIYGLFCLMWNIFGLGMVILMSIHPDVLAPPQTKIGRGPEFDGIRIEDLERSLQLPTLQEARVITKEDLCLAYVVAMLSILTTVALLYGVFRICPSYMVPFLCQHVFFFCLVCLTLVSYFTYVPHFNIKLWIRQNGLSDLPGVEHIMEIDSDYLMFSMITMLILFLCALAYLISMVWACYKYIQQLAVARTVTREYRVDPDTEMLLPPRYEDAIKPENSTQPPPPPYTQ